MADIMGIGEALNSKVAEKAYDDAGTKPAKQVGELAEDIVKSARLALLPFQILAALQDKFEKTLERVASNVPQEKRINPQLQIVGPIFENMKYMDDNGILYELFEELLARSIDSERIAEAHPSFIHIISQISHDEAILLYELKKNDFEVVDIMDFDRETNFFSNRKIEKTTVPKDVLLFPDKDEMYHLHLVSLSLVSWQIFKQEPIVGINNLQIGSRSYSKIQLTEFGKYFAKACIPENGFSLSSP
jgi:hypothetical protein